MASDESEFSEYAKWYTNSAKVLLELCLREIQLDPGFASRASFSKAYFNGKPIINYARRNLEVPYSKLFSNVKSVLENWSPDNSPSDVGQIAYDRLLRLAFSHTDPEMTKFRARLNQHSTSEKEFNVFVAAEVLQPLSGNTCVVNSGHETATVKNKQVKLPHEVGWKGLGMGFNCGFYGEPDMLIYPPTESSPTETGSGSVCVVAVSSVELDNDDIDDNDDNRRSPGLKKQKIDEEGKDDSPGKTAIEGKKAAKKNADIPELSQTIATALSFALVQRIRQKQLHTFPTLRVHPLGFEIVIYNTENDCLLLNSYGWTTKCLFFLWIVLNHKLFAFNTLEKVDHHECGYSHEANKLLKEEYIYLEAKSSLGANDNLVFLQRFSI